jgi:ABC-type sugar transport system substrate-binding protein
MRRVLVGSAIAGVLAFGATACGSSDDSGSTSAGSGSSSSTSASSDEKLGVQAGTGDRAQVATEAAKAAAKANGSPPPVPLPGKTIGIINIAGGQQSADRLAEAGVEAAKQLGWKTVECDGQGDPSKFASCADSLLNRNVDAITTVGIEPSLIASQLRDAKKKGVPVIQAGGMTELGGYSGVFYPDNGVSAVPVAQELVKELDSIPGDGEIQVAVHDFPAGWASVRTKVFKEAIKADPRIKVVAESTTDGADLVNFTRKTVTDQLTANPEIKAFWFSYDAAAQAAAQVIIQKYKGAKFPDRPLIVSFDADKGSLELMKQGGLDVIGDTPYDASQWVGMDQLAEYFARDTPISKDPQPEYPVVGSIYDDLVVTPKNMPAAGQIREPKYDFPTFFTEKWNTEFEKGNAG